MANLESVDMSHDALKCRSAAVLHRMYEAKDRPCFDWLLHAHDYQDLPVLINIWKFMFVRSVNMIVNLKLYLFGR